ncbi:relaxase/mobilization nuclease domain-containing protein [Ruminococcus bicirculans (ex Wegman et al. 2014)]|uniref:relaxase/mobilization nuclease domain-containing protein n=1 Tax=Ruminococcus bicirculans (ex Wegman et al. 2014) TaxID=1160721 RepID=UPI003FD8B7C3
MATTGFWPVKGRLKEVIDYANNPDKTTAKEYLDEDLYAAIRYVENDDKTDQTMFVSGINCSKHNAYNEMIAVKRRFGERGKNIAYHGYQSFVADEVTPDEAHAIGKETARKMWGARYQVVVTTHLNTDNIHNHFVINSVSFVDGKKFRNGIGDRLELRKISDAICAARNKSVIQSHKFYSNKKEYWIRNSGKVTHRDMLRRDVDEALSKCCSFKEIEYYLKTLGYRFERDFYYDHPSVYAEGWKRAVRISSLGERYSKERIREQCRENQRKPELYAFVTPAWKRRPLLVLERERYISGWDDTIIVLFELFIELLKICIVGNTQEYDNRPVSPMMRAEMRKLDQYIEEYNLLCDNNLNSPKKLLSFQENLSSRISELEQERYALRLKLRRVKTPEEDAALKVQAKELTKQITPLRKELKVALRIEEHIPRIKELLDAERNIELKHNGLVKKKERGYER